MPLIEGHVVDLHSKEPVAGAHVKIQCGEDVTHFCHTDPWGKFSFETVQEPGKAGCKVSASLFGVPSREVVARPDCADLRLTLDLSTHVAFQILSRGDCDPAPQPCTSLVAGREYAMDLQIGDPVQSYIHHVEWSAKGADITPSGKHSAIIFAHGHSPVTFAAKLYGTRPPGDAGGAPPPSFMVSTTQSVTPPPPIPVSRVSLQRSAVRPTREENLWTLIRANKRAIGFNEYREFINRVLCSPRKDEGLAVRYPTYPQDGQRFHREQGELISTFGVGAYELLRTATELFLLLNCRVENKGELEGEHLLAERARRQTYTSGDLRQMAQRFLGDNNYIKHVIEAAFPQDEGRHGVFCDGVLLRQEPCLIELIWSYWHEESMLTQSLAAISRRFQNHHSRGSKDPLAHFEMDPLRPLNNILWGYVQEEYRRLTIPRRSLEYSHHYGLTLFGKANPGARSADPRSKFLESFHNLLHRCAQFFKEDNDTTVIADGFPLLNALREVHLVLAQGAHNQFGDLPWTARVEMLIEQWIMARSETRDFLQSRAMVPYTQAWMPQVDTMKSLQGWTDISVSQFHDLGTYGEQLLLSIRFGNWMEIDDEDVAKNWARYWRPEAQGYLHAYRAVAGVDLTNPDTVDYTLPGVLLQRRLEAQARVR